MKATEDILGELHGIIAQSLIDKIKSGEATSGDLSVAVKFLKDNGINCIAERDDTMKELVDSLPSFPLDDGYIPMHEEGLDDIMRTH